MSETKKLEEIFSQAMQLADVEERRKYVRQACQGDVELAQHVSSLLKAAQEAGNFLESPVRESDQAKQTTAQRGPASSKVEFPFLTAPVAPDDMGSLGPFRILQCIGRGGMGIVFRAIDPKLQRVVAIKVLAPEIAIDPMARRRFEREARSAAAVSHPHVVVIYAVDETHNPPYIVMEFIQGKTLADKIASQGALSVKEILRIGAQIAKGLAAAHKQGVVHRDVKPANILLENGIERAKVTDFGLAKTMDDVTITRTGDLSGTPQFMSPEQARGGPVDHRTDLFSLGAVLYTMCTGRPPFRADNPLAMLKRICEVAPRPIQRANPDVPDWLCTIVDRLLAKSPSDRFQTAAEVAGLLQKYLAMLQSGPNLAPSKVNTQPHIVFNLRSGKQKAILVLGLLVGMGILVWLSPTSTQFKSTLPTTRATLTAEKAPAIFRAKFETTVGDFVIEVHREWSVNGADRFYNIVNSGLYDDCKFFRVLPNYMVQFGINGNPAIAEMLHEAPIKDDPVTISNNRGYVAFAKSSFSNSRTSQVFINFKDNKGLDAQGFAPFGQVVEGMNVVERINGEYGERPDQGEINSHGNEYLNATFPNLDGITKATIVN
jgi:serine/threonine protein kinase